MRPPFKVATKIDKPKIKKGEELTRSSSLETDVFYLLHLRLIRVKTIRVEGGEMIVNGC